MDKRKIILSFIGVLLIVLAVFGAKAIIDSNVKKVPKSTKVIKNVFVETVENRKVPIVVPANGNVTALKKLELFSEVQGIFQRSSKDFRPGQVYSRGQVLLSINSEEYAASVRSAKSELFNNITSIMPDLRLDYPESFPKWQEYLTNFDVNNSIKPLPEPDSDKERYFVTGRGIESAYYNIKNLEERLRKFTIRAPFDGVLTEAAVNPGTLVRPGQKLGEFIDPSVYELEVAVAKRFSDLLKTGEDVKLQDLEGNQTFKGTVSRINARVDRASQTIQVFIRIEEPGIREGMYLEAQLDARDEENAIEIPRELLIDRTKVYLVQDSALVLKEINPVYFSSNKVVVKGLEDGETLVSAPVPGAYPGMEVQIQEKIDTAKATEL
ncbi:efflux RND transporter periplasmic adaptor subunit [Salegentibacter maritimus]|uniref:Efflux RND transporter periplasmic adaptor subunit n=1 Tax=Salegentibacter maritimus TaxID=2794347 RepID=A0ABS0TDX7_9FLAO|nr:efflux RND transporter periplasmic adaptor subunit [Salegentibacter maritimus]MBI6119162.1 efflux RND transporter periplasmic adaptor subunit [Salegentibacter maritimus]